MPWPSVQKNAIAIMISIARMRRASPPRTTFLLPTYHSGGVPIAHVGEDGAGGHRVDEYQFKTALQAGAGAGWRRFADLVVCP